MIHLIKKAINPFGCDLVKFPHREDRRFIQLLSQLNIDTLFDVGANIGQFSENIRRYGYKNKIVSFEPLSEAFGVLQKKSKNDKLWNICNSAIGDIDDMVEINVSQNLQSSSILPMKDTHLKAAPYSRYYKKEKVKISRIDTIINNYADKQSNLFVKIDTQGFEKKVIEGAILSLPQIKGFIMELSFVPLYDGETLFLDMISYMESLQFEMWQIEPGFYDENKQRLLQADVVFVSKSQF
ncbi:FkbM family methyltransferase [Parabacteroides segnis]|uniref:FkbM family methyltransferase n=1 Tax=Parabacteroides segnis TaxID=2763058 RepID=UPI003519AAE4